MQLCPMLCLAWISFAVSPDLAQTWLRQLLGPGLLRVPLVYVLLTYSTLSKGLSGHQLSIIGHMQVSGLGPQCRVETWHSFFMGVTDAVFILYIFL